MKVTVINVVAFKVAWLLTVFAAAAGHGLIGPLVVTFWVSCFLYWQQGLKTNLLFIAVAFSVGYLLDMTLLAFGVIVFHCGMHSRFSGNAMCWRFLSEPWVGR